MSPRLVASLIACITITPGVTDASPARTAAKRALVAKFRINRHINTTIGWNKDSMFVENHELIKPTGEFKHVTLTNGTKVVLQKRSYERVDRWWDEWITSSSNKWQTRINTRRTLWTVEGKETPDGIVHLNARERRAFSGELGRHADLPAATDLLMLHHGKRGLAEAWKNLPR